MGVIWDIVKDIPTSAALKERILDFEAKLAASETQVSLTEIDLRKANVHIQELEAENIRLADQLSALQKADDSMHPIAHKIIAEFGNYSGGKATPGAIIRGNIPGYEAETSYHFDDLKKNGYIEQSPSFNSRTGPEYRLTQKGKKYWIDNVRQIAS